MNTSKKIVTSVGDSWVMSRSKTYPDRVYYFNTLTGKSVWNLSNVELKKANLSQHTHGESCPEPHEPPSGLDFSGTHLINSIPIIPGNAKVMNNQNMNDFNKINPFVASPYNMYMPFNAENCQTPMMPPYMWGMPPHPMFIAPVPIDNNRDLEKVIVQNTSIPLSNRFEQLNINTKSSTSVLEINNEKDEEVVDQIKEPPIRKFKNSRTKFDLRQVITSKRKRCKKSLVSANHNNIGKDNEDEVDEPYIPQPIKVHQAQAIAKSNQEVCDISNESEEMDIELSPDDESWLANNMHNQGSKAVLNVEPLRKMGSQCGPNEPLYIAADTNVLFSNLTFLNILIKSDDNCYLLVTNRVYDEVLAAAKQSDNRNNIPARMAFRFLTQLLKTGEAVTDRKLLSDATGGVLCPIGDDKILNCCSRLVHHKYHLILLSNDKLLQTKSSITSIPTFTVRQMKNYLGFYNRIYKDEENVILDKPILVTIDNTETRASQAQKVVKSFKNDTRPISINNNQKSPESNNAVLPTKSFSVPVPNNTEGVNENQDYPQKRELRLKRKITLPKSNIQKKKTVEKKGFRWRSRRSTSTTTLENQNHVQICEESEKEVEINNAELDESAESYSKNNSNFNISQKTIDESSVSEISNSEGSVSDKLLYYNKAVAPMQHYVTNDYSEQKYPKFEICDSVMKESLQLGSEEWVSRFQQIMECTLSQVLQQQELPNDINMPPPWSMHEATECIKKLFKNYTNIFKTAGDFSFTTYENSDKRGFLYRDMKPENFMKIFSIGVHLLNLLNEILVNNEDVRASINLLHQLLNDIKKPTSNDSIFLTDQNNEPSLQVSNILNSTVVSDFDDDSNNQKSAEKAAEPVQQKVSFVRKFSNHPDTLKSLKLSKQVDIDTSTVESQDTVENNISSNEDTSNLKDNTNTTVEPKVVRLKFSVCPEFEERIKKTSYHDLDELDYSEDENYDEEPFVEDEDFEDINKELSGSSNASCNKLDLLDYSNFIQEFKDSFLQVHAFCQQSYAEINEAEMMNKDRKFEIQKQAEDAKCLMDNLVSTLKTYSDIDDFSEKYSNDSSDQSPLIRDVITKCVTQANILQKALSCLTDEVLINV